MILTFYNKNFCLTDSGDLISVCRRKIKVQDYVWESWNNKIPSGFKVVHADGNKFNNSITNLELIPVDRDAPVLQTNTNYSTAQQKGRPRGIHAKKQTGPRPETFCKACNKPLTGFIKKIYCDSKCKHNYQDRNKIFYTFEKICPCCNNPFKDTPWGKKKLCSVECALKNRSVKKQPV